ncbi:MAG: aminotransferase class V-fold PLP-dependent enzyme [Candidatus Asgardarchaeia archaeon]
MIDVQRIREDFPILKRQINGKPLIYFDNTATTQKPIQVINAIREFYEGYNANIHRGVHTLSQEASEAYEAAHEKVAKFINARSWKEIIFVRNTTEAINLVAYSWGYENLKEGDEIVTTIMEHHSNFLPWLMLSKRKKLKLKVVDINQDGTLNFDDLEEKITNKTKLVAITHVSNVLGTINPVKDIIKIAHDNNALVLLDGAQSVPHLPVDVRDLDCDFLVFSGHKMLGPTGIGALYGKEEILESMNPFLFGGDMIKDVWIDRAEWNELPWKFEAGTSNIAGGIGFGTAIDYLTKIGMSNVREHELDIVKYTLKGLEELDNIKIYGPPAEKRGGVISFNINGMDMHDVAMLLDQEGIAVRSGGHCAHPLMRRLKINGTVRASFYIYNTRDEVDYFIKVLSQIAMIS